MESVELKLREIDNDQFVVGYTKRIVEILGEPELSLEVKVESLGYHVAAKKAMDGWIRLKAVKLNK